MAHLNRREFMRRIALTASAGSLMLCRSAWSLTRHLAKALPIAALVPRDPSGHQFVLFSDCTVTGEDKGSTEALHNIGLVVQRLVPSPEFISFPGDAVGSGDNEREWEFFREELKWSREEGIAVYQATSNHTAYSFKSEARFREFNRDLPLNGPVDEKGLAYWVRRGNLLYVSLHHPASSTRYRAGYDFGDMTWLEDVLARNSDAEYRLVVGHYPVFRVNGYTEMSIPHADWGPFWATLRKHRVDAYLTSHVLAFDVQVHDGILQICSGGAGPGAMPPATEGTHAVQIAIDRQGIRFQVLNIEGSVRESLVWPFQPPESASWTPPKSWVDKDWVALEPGQPASLGYSAGSHIELYRFEGLRHFSSPHESRLALMEGSKGGRRTLQVWVDLLSLRLYVTVEIKQIGPRDWMGPILDFGNGPIGFHLAFHPGMGPGGILWRWSDDTPWNSMETTSEFGLEGAESPDTITRLEVSAAGIYSRALLQEPTYQVTHAEMALPQV